MNSLLFKESNADYYINGEEPDQHGELFIPEWEINPDLKKAVYEGIPPSLSPEAKAMFIYFRLCYLLKYDEGYMYSNRIGPEKRKRYDNDFSKEQMESIMPNSNVTCFELARLFCKFVNDFDSCPFTFITPIYKLHGINHGHASMGFYTRRAAVELDPILLTLGKQSNDLLNLKLGAVPDGMHIIYEKNDIISKCLETIYPAATTGEYPTSFQYRLLELSELSKKKAGDKTDLSLEDKLKAFSEILKSKGIVGNEAVQLLINFNKYGFFDERLKIALCAEKRGGTPYDRSFIRKALMRIDNGDDLPSNRDKYDYFLLDTKTLELGKVDPNEMSLDFITNLYTFESEKQEGKMPELLDEER